MANNSENDEIEELDSHAASWSVIPSARSSQTVRRQEKFISIDALKENLLWKSTDELNSEFTRDMHEMPVGVCSKLVTRGSSKLDASVPSMQSLPHPSKLKKRKQKRSKNVHTPRHSQYGFNVTAHVAQLKRKHVEFNWLPSHPTDDISSPSCTVDEDPFPPESNGPQCVPSTPTLVNDFYELQSEISEWPLQLPTLIQSSENGVVADLFKGYHQLPQILSGPFSIPSYAVATREQSQEVLRNEECHIDTRMFPAFSTASRSGQPSMEPSFNNPQFSSDHHPCFPKENPLKEE